MTDFFKKISDKVEKEQRITEDDALYLYEHADLIDLGQLADFANKRKNGYEVYYNVNRHINPTNVCAKSCKFCAFSRKPGEEGAYAYSIADILDKAKEVVAQGATEVHMVGGLHPRWRFTHYLEIIGALKQAHPDLHVKAFTAVEIDWLAAKARMSIEDTLRALKDAGLGSLPGGGAEIFHPDIRSQICDTKTDAERWIEIHRTAHSLGMRSNCTMLYGHIESPVHRVDHMRRLRDLQDETHGFNVFIPLAFQPYDNDMGINRFTPGCDDLRTLAIARLYLDNFRHIKAYWVMLGQDVAQLALNFGANDLDGTVTEEKISRMAGGRSGMVMGKPQIHNLIRKAGRIPVERDTLYKPVWRDPSDQTTINNLKKSSSQVELLLYKVEKGEELPREEAELLAEHAELLALAHAAKVVRNQFDGTLASLSVIEAQRYSGMHTTVESLDLAADPELKLIATALPLLTMVTNLKANGSHTLTLYGIKRIWEIANASKTSLETLLSQLKNAGVTVISSSADETELDFTNSELIHFHKSCHALGIKTIAKLEFDANFSGTSRPYWDRFLRRAEELRKLQDQSASLLAINVETGRDSFITPSEYLRAVAMARITLNNVPHILTPFKKIPTFKPRVAQKSDALNDPVFKILPLMCFFGASDFGLVRDDQCDAESIVTELSIAGFSPNVRYSAAGLS